MQKGVFDSPNVQKKSKLCTPQHYALHFLSHLQPQAPHSAQVAQASPAARGFRV